MTTMTNVACELKFVRVFDNGHGEEGFGFFSLRSLGLKADAHFDIALLRENGFDPHSQQSGSPAVIDIRSDSNGKIHTVAIHKIGDQVAGEPLSSPEVKPAKERTVTRTRHISQSADIGDVLVGTFKFGFDGKFSNVGYFTPISGPINGRWDILVPIEGISDLQLRAALDDSEAQFELEITSISEKGYAGRVRFLKLDTAELNRQAQESAAAKAAEKAEREARRQMELKKLRSREQVVVTADGSFKLYGIPVTDAEWAKLPEETFIVLVDSYDEETGKWSGLRSHFKVGKRGGTPRKLAEKTDVKLWKESEVEREEPFVPVDFGLVEIIAGEGAVRVPIFVETARSRVEKLLGILRAHKLKVEGRLVEYIVLKVGGEYALVACDGSPKRLDKPQLLSLISV